MEPTRSERRLPLQVRRERLLRVMANELTEKQRRAVEDYYLHGKRIPEMAREYGVNKSTVSRTLRRAMGKLRRFMKY